MRCIESWGMSANSYRESDIRCIGCQNVFGAGADMLTFYRPYVERSLEPAETSRPTKTRATARNDATLSFMQRRASSTRTARFSFPSRGRP